MVYLKYLITGVTSFLIGSHCFHHQDKKTIIRVVNSTEFEFSNVSLFSIKFENLYPGDTSCFKDIHYDYLIDDPLIYATINNINLGLYLEIPVEDKKNTYTIDSVDLNNKRLYVNLNERIK